MIKCIIAVEEKPRVQFTIDADPDNMPQLIILKDDEKLMLVGRYASKGNNYRYSRVFRIHYHKGEVKDYPQYSHLIG